MNQRHPLAVVAGVGDAAGRVPADARSSTSWTWLIYAAFAVAVVVGAAMLVRDRCAARSWAQVLAMLGALLLFLTVRLPERRASSSGSSRPARPSRHFNDLLVASGDADPRRGGIPVAGPRRACCCSPRPASAWSPSWSTWPRSGCAGRRWPGCRCSPSTRCRSRCCPTACRSCRSRSPRAGYLWLLVSDSVDRVRRFGRRFTGEGRDVDLWEPSPLSAAGRRLGVVGVVVAMLLPLAIPGMTAGLLRPLRRPRVGDGPAAPAPGPAPAVGQPERVARPDSLHRDDAHRRWSRSPPTTRPRTTCGSASPTRSTTDGFANRRRRRRSRR